MLVISPVLGYGAMRLRPHIQVKVLSSLHLLNFRALLCVPTSAPQISLLETPGLIFHSQLCHCLAVQSVQTLWTSLFTSGKWVSSSSCDVIQFMSVQQYKTISWEATRRNYDDVVKKKLRTSDPFLPCHPHPCRIVVMDATWYTPYLEDRWCGGTDGEQG